MRVLVTRAQPEGREWVEALRAGGVDAVALALIAISPTADPEPLLAAWSRLDGYGAVMFVSGNAVRFFFARRPPQLRWNGSTRAWATGPGTRQALRQAGVPDALTDAPAADSRQFDSEALWRLVEPQVRPGSRVLIVRGGEGDGGEGRDFLSSRLAERAAAVDHLAVYRRDLPQLTASERAHALRGTVEGTWLFSSSRAIANLLSLLPGQDWSAARALVTHPRIAQAARSAGFGVVDQAHPTLDGVLTALESVR